MDKEVSYTRATRDQRAMLETLLPRAMTQREEGHFWYRDDWSINVLMELTGLNGKQIGRIRRELGMSCRRSPEEPSEDVCEVEEVKKEEVKKEEVRLPDEADTLGVLKRILEALDAQNELIAGNTRALRDMRDAYIWNVNYGGPVYGRRPKVVAPEVT